MRRSITVGNDPSPHNWALWGAELGAALTLPLCISSKRGRLAAEYPGKGASIGCTGWAESLGRLSSRPGQSLGPDLQLAIRPCPGPTQVTRRHQERHEKMIITGERTENVPFFRPPHIGELVVMSVRFLPGLIFLFQS